LAEHGLKWIDPPFALAHPLDDGTAAILERSVEATAARLGADAAAYQGLLEPPTRRSAAPFPEIHRPNPRLPRPPRRAPPLAFRAVRFEVRPRQLVQIAGAPLPPRYVRRLSRFRYGPGVFKIDWALDGPIPWRAPDCARAGTVHVGGTIEEIARHESEVWRGRMTDCPFTLVAQQSAFDSSRATVGKHTGWAYCLVPHCSTADLTDAIERTVVRLAPG